MSDEDGNTSWNLSFDDDFDTSSDSLPAPSSLPMVADKRVFSNASDEGYKSASKSHARLENTSSSTNQSLLSHQSLHAFKEGTPATRTQKQRSLRSMGLGHVTSGTQKASTHTPPARHRQVNSMVYSSSPSPKWQGKPVTTSPSSKRVISPHNSPLMSSFAKAREQQERISQGTLSGLIMRFIRNRTLSTLSLRLALLVSVLLLTSLVLTKHPDRTPTHAHYSETTEELDDSEVLRAFRGDSGTKHTPQFVGTTQIEEEIGDLPGIQRWKQEERRVAHVRLAKSFQQASDAQELQEDTKNENDDEDGDESGLFEDALIRADLEEAEKKLVQEDLDQVERSEQEDDKFAVDQGTSLDARQYGENDVESSNNVDAESAIARAATLNRDRLELGRHMKESIDQSEEEVLVDDSSSWRDEPTDDSHPVEDDSSKPLPVKPAAGRAAILAQVEASRELALLEYQRLKGERDLDLQPSTEDTDSDLMKAELEDRDGTRPSKEELPLQRQSTIPVGSEAEELEGLQDGLESTEEIIHIEDDDLSTEVDPVQNGETSLLDANAAVIAFEDARNTPSHDTLQVEANILDRSAQEEPRLPPRLMQGQKGGFGRQERTGLIKQRSKSDTISQDESTSFEANIAIVNARKAAKKNIAAGRVAGKRRINAS